MELRSREDGFSLVEVMVSLVIFMVASMGLLHLLVTNLQVNHDNHRHAQARRLAGELMAELQVADYASLPHAAEAPVLVAGIEVQPLVEQNVPRFGQSRLTVTALWQQRGHDRRYQLQTIRSSP